MYIKKKRERNENYSPEDTERLMGLVYLKRNIIESKGKNHVTWQKKEMAWCAIEKEFNVSRCGPYRDSKHLKLKYDALKRDVRKKTAASATPQLTPIEEKVMEMLLMSVNGGECTSDSDQLDMDVSQDAYQDIRSPEIFIDESGSNFILGPNVKLENNDEPVRKKQRISPVDEDAMASTSEQNTNNTSAETGYTTEQNNTPENHHNKWNSWRAKQQPVLFKPLEERSPFSKLSETRLEMADLKKTLVEKEIQEKTLQIELIQQEKQQKLELHELEKEHLRLKIDLIRMEIEKRKDKH